MRVWRNLVAMAFVLLVLTLLLLRITTPPRCIWSAERKFNVAKDRILAGEEVEELIGALQNPMECRGLVVVDHLLLHGGESEVRQALREATLSDNPVVEIRAKYALFRLRDDPNSMLEELLACLQSDDAARVVAAGEVIRLRGFGSEDATFVPRFLDLLVSDSPLLRHTAVVALGMFPETPGVLPALLRVVESDSDDDVVRAAIKMLGEAAIRQPSLVGDARILETLISILEARTYWRRHAALSALCDHAIADEAAKAIRQVFESDSHPDMRASAAFCLIEKRPWEEARSVLLKAFDDTEPVVQRMAMRGLVWRWPMLKRFVDMRREWLVALEVLFLVLMCVGYWRARVRAAQQQ